MAENNRVLNFAEFGKKYSQEAAQDNAASYSEFTKSAENFQEGFDDDTYGDGQIGPNRPMSVGSSKTPAQPGEDGAPSFSYDSPSGMEAPDVEQTSGASNIGPASQGTAYSGGNYSDSTYSSGDYSDEYDSASDESPEYSDDEEDEDWDDYGDPESENEDEANKDESENENEDDEEDEEDEEEDDEEDEEEDEESNESKKYKFILESFDDFNEPLRSQPRSGYSDILDTIELEEFEEDPYEESDTCMVRCRECGAEKLIGQDEYPLGKDNVSDPSSWWQGAKFGMNCGCK